MSEIEKGLGQKRVMFRSGAPAQLLDSDASPVMQDFDEAGSEAFIHTFREYRQQLRAALKTTRADSHAFLPEYMRAFQRIVAIRCHDGIAVRYEPTTSEVEQIVLGISDEPLSSAVVGASEGWFALETSEGAQAERAPMQFSLTRTSIATGVTEVIASIGFGLVVKVPSIDEARALGRPSNIGMTPSSLSVALQGLLAPEPGKPPTGFTTVVPIKLPVGFTAVEVFAPYLGEQWDRRNAKLWAQADIDAAVARRHVEEAKWDKLDPKLPVRKKLAELMSQFAGLFHEPEQKLQTFLEANPFLLCATHSRCWRKLPFGKTVSDFVFQRSDQSYVLVEIERGDRKLLRRDGQQSEELTHAINQITDWRRYIEDNLSTVRGELELGHITASPDMLIVIGRSADLDEAGFRKIRAIQDQIPRLRILTWDQLLEEATTAFEHLFGPLPSLDSNIRTYFYPVTR